MPARLHLKLGVVDHASEVIKAAQAILDGTILPEPAMPVDDPGLVMRERRRGAGMITIEVLPSPAFLRWLANHIEDDLAYRKRIDG